jgi:hypothetical protein
VVSIAAKLIPKGDDQWNPEQPKRNQKYILLKHIQSEQIGANPNILHLNKGSG